MKDYNVKDMKLADQGLMNIEYAESQMGALLQVQERFKKEKPFKGMKIGLALHVTKETAVLVKTLIAGGAKVAITGCNPLSTQDDVAAALAKLGVNVYAWKGESTKEYYENLNAVLDFEPNATIDDGCDLVTEIHLKRPQLIKDIVVGTEETTTGVIRLRAMEKDHALKYPVVAVNDNKTKHLVDNYYGTGQSTIDGLLRASNTLFAGKNFVVCGYGDCGKGLAQRAKGMSSNVIVCETDSFRALQASLDGFRVMPILEAAELGDIFITVTGNKNVIRWEHMKQMKSGTILANSGHFDAEIDVKALKENTKSCRRIRPQFDEYVLPNGNKVFLAGEGRLVNLAVAEGHPSTVMSLSFCGQALAVEYGVKNKLSPAVHTLPESVDDMISELQLKVMGIRKDVLTEEQKKYLGSWKEGT
ncbi:MAG: adenosylhomocysteinase [Candidatus Diapherotrites archaeon CG08_land_8_20_14_0_20_34_12]|nr:MAG: adenosylhomocysteinase [Candidatus Diapherotrites archaeon CG08_land_8_20_14_0_20_34_12]